MATRIDTDNHHHVTTDNRSLAELIRELRDESTVLLRQEVALAKTEMSENASRMGRNIGYLAVGGAIALMGLFFLLFAASAGINLVIATTEWAPHGVWIAPLIVAVVVGIIGLGLVSKAKNTLSHASLVPHQTIDTLKVDQKWARAKVQ